MLVNEIIKRIRFRVADEDVINYTDEHILDVINSAHKFIMGIYIEEIPDHQSERGSGTLEPGENFIQLTPLPLRVLDVRCDGHIVHYSTERDVYDTVRTGRPTVYVVSRNGLRLYPIPDNNYQYSVDYVPETVDLDMYDEFPYPQDLVDYIVEYAVVRLGTVDGANISTEASIFGELRGVVMNHIANIVPSPCVVDSYY